MNRAWIGIGAFAAASLAAQASARADESSMLQIDHEPARTAQNFEMEARVALYQPQVDSAPGLTGTPYKDTFGTQFRYELALEFDWQALRIPHVGSLGPGVSIGYTKSTGLANRPTVNGEAPLPPSEETTTLEILPTYAVAVFRFDGPYRDLHIPLVPYAKAGVGYALWRASNTGGTSVSDTGVVGKGHTFGTHLAIGVQFALSVLDQHASQQLDESTGINNSYLFAEYMRSDLTGIGQSNALYVGSDSFAFGLAFEF